MKRQTENKQKERQAKDMIDVQFDQIVIDKKPGKILFCCAIRDGTQKSCFGIELTLTPPVIEEIAEKIAKSLTLLFEEAQRKQRNNVNGTLPLTT